MLVNSPLAEVASVIAFTIREGLTPQPYVRHLNPNIDNQLGSSDLPTHLYVGTIYSLSNTMEYKGILSFDGVNSIFKGDLTPNRVMIFTYLYLASENIIFVGYRIPLIF